jgi:S-adenosylmethionine hydrolase
MICARARPRASGYNRQVVPIIGLLTDFGLRDHYVGAMKGAILSICPQAVLVDVLHEVPRHDVEAGAFALDAAYPHFPEGTVFAAVVDPGVGTSRRPIAVSAGGWLFVGPDNGVFTFVLDAHPGARVHLLADARLRREPVSAVFHGRDLFGPAAARLALGFPIEQAGPAVSDAVRLSLPPKLRRGGGWDGAVVRVDGFGNLTTNILAGDLAVAAGEGAVEVRVGARVLPFVATYGDVASGEPCALMGSSGRLEIAVNGGRADALLGASRGTRVSVRRAGAGGTRRGPRRSVLD